MAKIIIFMGVAGCGKTTTASYLSQELGWKLYEGDSYHPQANIEMMRNAVPLSDENRYAWLNRLNQIILDSVSRNESMMLTCSALKQRYRDMLTTGLESTDSSTSGKADVLFVHLYASYEVIYTRLSQCNRLTAGNHFFPVSLLQSQYDILEPPDIDAAVTTTNGHCIRAIQISAVYEASKIKDIVVNELRYRDKSSVGVFGLGTMGSALARNIARGKQHRVSLYNRFVPNEEEKVAFKLLDKYADEFQDLAKGYEDLELFLASLARPRLLLLLIDAGKVIDIVLQQFIPLLDVDDIVVDLGNSYYLDTIRRVEELQRQGSRIHFLGSGISGGEYGALNGASIMLSGDSDACHRILALLSSLASLDRISSSQQACCAYIGNHGSGHYVKMIHNGIEYAEMQLLVEVVQLCRVKALTYPQIAEILSSWRRDSPETQSYLLDITITILTTADGLASADGRGSSTLLLEKIVDNAQSKGTGNWATIELTKESIPATMIASALYARFISSYRDLRLSLASIFPRSSSSISLSLQEEVSVEEMRQAYQLARIINHSQAFSLLAQISSRNAWQLNLAELARIWTNGCIIRSDLMQSFYHLLTELSSSAGDLLFRIWSHPFFIDKIQSYRAALKRVVSVAISAEEAVPCLNEALNFLNAITTARSASNLIQAQRDYFGAHRYQRIDRPLDQSFHFPWPS
jgi:6-phosphogluconate dehydrogenase